MDTLVSRMDPDALAALDRRHLVHPVTNYREHEARGVNVLSSGKGAYLTDNRGHTLIDMFAGLWCVNVGYGQQSVVDAATRQMAQLPYATSYFGFGSEPAILLADALVQRAPASIEHVYFTLGGSDAVDSAIRFITYFYNAQGQSARRHFVSLARGYHGSSSVGAGLTALPAFHTGFNLPLSTQHYIASPYAYRHEHGDDPVALIASSVQALKDKVTELGPENVAAFFCEPVQGSGGVIVPPKGWLRAMADACRELDILFVADEVITGFGRTGPLFACEDEAVSPDLMIVAKGLTSGYVPMGAVFMSDRIYQGIAQGNAAGTPVGHGHTYSAHPVSAAVGLEVLRLYEEGGLLANGRAVAGVFAKGLTDMLDHPLVGDARSRGLLGALELVANKTTRERFDPNLKLSDRIAAAAYKRGVVFRAFADNILGFAPALCFSADDFDVGFGRIRQVLDDVLAEKDVRASLK